MSWEFALCEQQLLQEIADSRMKRRDVAQTYRLAMQSSEVNRVDWSKVNAAIMQRWSRSALEWIKQQAWSGECFEHSHEKRLFNLML